MHYAVVERWSRGNSPLHHRDARAKILVLLVFLIALATLQVVPLLVLAAFTLLLVLAIVAARLPMAGVLIRAGVVLPFTLVFVVVTWLAGHPDRALSLLEKSYLSALAVLLLVSVTPLPSLLDGVESLGAPRFLVLVVQFLYRYLFVVSDQARNMVLAARCRGFGGPRSPRGDRFQAAAGALAVLFARAHGRSEGIYRAMLARGFDGIIRPVTPARFQLTDAVFVVMVFLSVLAIRAAAALWMPR